MDWRLEAQFTIANISLFVFRGVKKYGSVQGYDDGKKKGVFVVKKWGGAHLPRVGHSGRF